MKERLEKRNKILSKLPDHQDLFKTGEKIQKGYWLLFNLSKGFQGNFYYKNSRLLIISSNDIKGCPIPF